MGWPVIADLQPGCGPLSGIHAALSASRSEWNLIVACDMPEITVPFLADLLEVAAQRGTDCLVPVGPSGRPEPLCAIYNRRILARVTAALEAGVRKIMDALSGAKWSVYPVADSAMFRNLNTPAEWLSYPKIKTRDGTVKPK
jgi:molybdopterin-guanine dinucleotide biosynthesis protein A